jgi:uncharacterized protein Veg
MISKEIMQQVRKDVESYIGEEINIRSNIGRNKKINKRGVIDSAYSNLFIVKEPEGTRKLSYSYADVLMNSLEITKVESGEQIINYEFDTSKKTIQL